MTSPTVRRCRSGTRWRPGPRPRPASTAGGEVLGPPGPTRGDHRDRHGSARTARIRSRSKPVLGAVRVHRVEQDLASAELGAARGPVERVEAGGLAAAVRGDLEARVGAGGPAGVDGEHEHLVAEAVGDLGDQRRPVDGGGVDRDLVGTGPQQPVDVVDRGHAAADGERDEDLLGRPRHDLQGGGPALVRGGDVEEGELVGARRVVAARASSTGSPASRSPWKLTPLTTRPASTSRHGMTRTASVIGRPGSGRARPRG